MSYKLIISHGARRDLKRLPLDVKERLAEAMAHLTSDPRPQGYLKLKGQEYYRIRVGNYRIVYDINDQVITITIIATGHRKNIYRNL